MNKIFFLILSVPTFAMASWGVGGSMHSVSDVDSGYGDLEFGITSLNGVYENRSDNLALQVKVGLGLSDDSDKDDDGDSYDLELNHMLQLKGMYFMNDNIYAALTYTNYDIDTYIEYADETEGGSENDFGFMLGYRKDNLDLYFGPAYDEGSEGKIMEFGFTYFIN